MSASPAQPSQTMSGAAPGVSFCFLHGPSFFFSALPCMRLEHGVLVCHHHHCLPPAHHERKREQARAWRRSQGMVSIFRAGTPAGRQDPTWRWQPDHESSAGCHKPRPGFHKPRQWLSWKWGGHFLTHCEFGNGTRQHLRSFVGAS